MPELPEVESVRTDLERILVGKETISAVKLLSPRLRTSLNAKSISNVVGKPIYGIRRRAKYILIDFEDGVLLSHLGMTGSWRTKLGNEDEMKHDHVIFSLSSGRQLVYRDPRRFGILEWVKSSDLKKNRWLKNLGPEPLGNEFSVGYFFSEIKKKKAPIKTTLMNQKLVVGLGNIYVNESLFLAGISPRKISRRISFSHCEKLYLEIIKILKLAIKRGGTTISDYRRADGNSGSFQNELFVYNRVGLPCKRCETPIKSTKQAGRSTFWCSLCQK
ncbi:MAG: hypothetical protein A4S09_06900 [Proteobacteria bacterium SG_bin7]|nr:MAG: hypothetical protein A4S09_06900 [Proteobacteria bacterium SG_bin7]